MASIEDALVTAVVKWEYETRSWVGLDWNGDANVRAAYKMLSEMGNDGWELAAVIDGIAIFKRPRYEMGG